MMGANDKPDATWHPGTGPTPRGAADVLREHRYTWHEGPGAGFRCCGAWVEGSLWDHLADMLATAGLLATADPVVIEVHHHDIEKHAEHFNEGYETAVAQGLADDPTLAADWLAEHDAQVAAQALRDAASEDWPAAEPLAAQRNAIRRWLRARADRIAGGAA